MSSYKNGTAHLLVDERFLTESEVRDSIRRQILLYESLKNPLCKLILEQDGTGGDSIARAWNASGMEGMGMADAARTTSNAISAMAGVGTTAGIMSIPLVPISWKLKAIGFIGAGVAVAIELVKEVTQVKN